MTTEPETVTFHLILTVEQLGDWIEYCKEKGYDPRGHAVRTLMEEVFR